MIEQNEEVGAADEVPSVESGLLERVAASFCDFESIGVEIAAGLGL